MQYNVNRAREALQYVVRSPYYSQLWRKIQATAKKPRSVPFKGDQEVLNELVLIGRQKLSALDNLYKIVQQKRRDKNSYQREFMAAKRRRDRKFIRQQELVTGTTMTPEQRQEALSKQYEIWHKQRDELVKACDSVSWEDRNDRIKAFWADIDEELDKAITEFS